MSSHEEPPISPVPSCLAVLALAEELGSVTEACRRAGISRSRFYELKQAFPSHGVAGLAPSKPRTPRMPNQTPGDLEQGILNLTLQFPTYSYARISSGSRSNRQPGRRKRRRPVGN
jgi:hypothetical protein